MVDWYLSLAICRYLGDLVDPWPILKRLILLTRFFNKLHTAIKYQLGKTIIIISKRWKFQLSCSTEFWWRAAQEKEKKPNWLDFNNNFTFIIINFLFCFDDLIILLYYLKIMLFIIIINYISSKLLFHRTMQLTLGSIYIWHSHKFRW